MLYHHDHRDYRVAATESAAKWRHKMEKQIEAGKASAMQLFEHAHSAVPDDAIVRGGAMQFVSAQGRLEMAFGMAGSSLPLHRHALNQVAQKADIPYKTLSGWIDSPDPWEREMAAEVLNRIFHNKSTVKGKDVSGARMLVRSFKSDRRAVLSDRFRRLDNRPLLEQFAASCKDIGAVPVEGIITDLQLRLKAYLPLVFEPVEGEVMCFGLSWGNSDFGAGRHVIRCFCRRLWCTNDAEMEDVLAQVHIGSRLAESFEFSQKTYELDTAAQVSAMKDVIMGALAPKNVHAMLDTIKRCDEQKLDWKNVSSAITKKLLKHELKAVREAFDGDDVVNLPANHSPWRLSNAISWIAGKTEDADRKLQLQRIAGMIVTGKSEKEEEAVAA
jgi:hypothetical protein